ncbi:TIR-NBS-LRR type disease resistance protein, putative [Medicago truncatula]|uniref:TIR-NBS-LRR type disease resistance protein, putative n=1 Tax=Medicago truncatula TaxID=3880 RepID=G7L1U5_MEDTR|nr:TIR-NBS-LRR type disease resistance protein, putative [Medicago truncatula]
MSTPREFSLVGRNIYIDKVRSRNRVGMIVDKECKKDIMDAKRLGNRIIVQKFVVDQDTFNVISAYTS